MGPTKTSGFMEIPEEQRGSILEGFYCILRVLFAHDIEIIHFSGKTHLSQQLPVGTESILRMMPARPVLWIFSLMYNCQSPQQRASHVQPPSALGLQDHDLVIVNVCGTCVLRLFWSRILTDLCFSVK